MRAILTWILALSAVVFSDYARSQHAHNSEYVGEERRQIKSLSDDDISELRQGSGWGLAKAAELNGVPGPSHLLELSQEIPLSDSQFDAIQGLFRSMQSAAIEEGENLIRLEQRLDAAFADGTITEPTLRRLVSEISQSRGRLRYIHLATHLATPELLTEQQVARYNQLRGYTADPCQSVPAGHDAAIWRKHNGCKQ